MSQEQEEGEDVLIARYGIRKLAETRAMVRECQTGHFIVLDNESNTVFYRDAHSERRIPTNYSNEHIHIAHREFLAGSPDRILWDRLNSEVSGYKRDYYRTNNS